jgi:hypothetical protein
MAKPCLLEYLPQWAAVIYFDFGRISGEFTINFPWPPVPAQSLQIML